MSFGRRVRSPSSAALYCTRRAMQTHFARETLNPRVLSTSCPVLDAGPGAVPHLHTLLAQHVSIFRQVLSLVELPDLADAQLFPNDVILRARNISRRADNERHVREAVARHILVRDKGKREHTCTAEQIVLSNGARDASLAIQLQLCSELDGILVPSPDFTFAPSAALHGARVFRYGLEYASQEAEWRLSVRELEAALARARAQGFRVRALAVNNPALTLASREELQEVVMRHEL